MSETRQERRVIGLDAHPYLFSAAALGGADALQARVEWCVDRADLAGLEKVMKKRARPGDTVVLEASGNSFAVALRLQAIGLVPVVLESQSVGKVGKAYCATDKVDAVKIARVYLSGLAHEVWRPDGKTGERRELFFVHQWAVKETTRIRNRIWAFLNQQCVRRPVGLRLASPRALPALLALREWSPVQALVLEEMVGAFQHAEERRRRMRGRLAAEVAADPQVLKLTRLLGVRARVAFALAAFIGPVDRFASPKKLVAFLGLNPMVSRSGIGGGNGPLSKYGRGDVRSLLIQAAQCILRCGSGSIHRWGLRLKMRKGNNIAAAAVARKLAVSVWYLMKGFFTPLTELTESMKVKMHKIACEIGKVALKAMGYSTLAEFEKEKLEILMATT